VVESLRAALRFNVNPMAIKLEALVRCINADGNDSLMNCRLQCLFIVLLHTYNTGDTSLNTTSICATFAFRLGSVRILLLGVRFA
jgi:hypothetical protein